MEKRLKLVFKASIIGIAVNLLLAVFKIVVGTIANAISVKMDGINNLSDAASGLITIVGAAFAGKEADKKHPFGYGRIEYLSSLLIGGLVLYAGVTAFISAIQSIMHPEAPEYTKVSMIVISVAVIVKLFLSLYTQAMGKKANSDSLVASGKESILDVFISVSTIVAAIIYLIFGLALEAYLAAIISLLIVKTGLELLRDIISKIIGEPSDVQLVIDLKRTITSFEHVNGAYDLVINDYGPETNIASVHIEVDDTLAVNELDALIRKITGEVLAKHGVILTAVGVYCHNTMNQEIIDLEKAVKKILLEQEHVLGAHGFFADLAEKKMSFDAVISLNADSRQASFEKALAAVKNAYPDFNVTAAMDMDFNELN